MNRPVGIFWYDILFHQQLKDIGHRLKNPIGANPVRPNAVLNRGTDPPFGPHEDDDEQENNPQNNANTNQ